MAMAASLTLRHRDPGRADDAARRSRRRAAAGRRRRSRSGRLSSAAYDAWTAQTPDDAGPARAARRSRRTSQRFNAATFRWVGGDNLTDDPDVVVERLVDGAVAAPTPTRAARCRPCSTSRPSVAASLPSTTAPVRSAGPGRRSFEAFDAYPRAAVPGGQVPNGTYRFLVRGASHTGGAVVPYALASQPFRVGRWTGLRAASRRRAPAAAVTLHAPARSSTRGPTARRSGSSPTTSAASTQGPATPTTASCAAPAPSGPGPRPGGSWPRRSTSWRRTGGSARSVPAVSTGDGAWTADAHLAPGEHAVVPAGALRDGYGETNGVAAG